MTVGLTGVALLGLLPVGEVVGAQPGPSAGSRGPVQPALPESPAAIAAQGETAVVVHGAPSSTLAVYDAAGRSVWEGPLPFASQVAYPEVTALDDGSYAVTGVPCATARPDDDTGPRCAPGGVALARFDPSTKTFTPLSVPGLEGTTSYVDVLGASGEDLVVQIGGGLHLVAGDGSRSVALPASPFESTTLACVQGDQVVVVEQKLGAGDTSPEPGEIVEVAAGPFVPFEAAVLDLTTQRWTNLGGPDAHYGSSDTFEIGCLDQGVLAAPSERPLTPGAPHASFVFDVAAGGWHQAAPPPREFLAAAPAASDGNELALSVSSDLWDADTAVLVFDAGSGTWSETPGGSGATSEEIELAEGRLWELPPSDSESESEPAAAPAVADLGQGPIPDRSPSVDQPTPPEPLAVPSPSGPAAAAATFDIGVFEWNMCGNACYGNRIDPADKVAWTVIGSNPRPWSASLNEVCHSSNQHYRMVNALDDVGYHGEVYVARNNFVPCGNRSYGNSVFSVGGPISVSRYSFQKQDGSPEVRGVVCSKDTGFLGDWQACSTHLDSDTANSSVQANQLRQYVSVFGNMLVIVGGDFNLPPTHASINAWRASYDEIDEVAPFGNTTDTHGKLDYIWIRDTGVMSSPYAPVITNDTGNPSSDHHFYGGRFRFTG